MLTVHCIFVTLDAHICLARSIQPKYPEISVSPKPNGSVRSNWKSFEKTGPPFEVDHACRLDWSDRKMTVPFDFLGVYHWEKKGDFSLPVQFCDLTIPMLENLLSHESQA